MLHTISFTVFGLLLLLSGSGLGETGVRSCPCERPELCEPVDVPEQRKELFVFSTGKDTWRKWNWTAITTVIAFGYDDPQLMCFAHAHKARYGMVVGPDPSLLVNHTAADLWINNTLDAAESRFSDAINIDTEQAVAANSTERDVLTQLTKNLTERFKQRNSRHQVTFDLAWRPGGVDGRFYDEKAIADAVDFVFIMSYDTQSQIKTGPCIAKANIPYSRIIEGYESYLNLGIPASKLVMGLPWYGYVYPCLTFDNLTSTCEIRKKPFRGVNCSDAAGGEYDLARVIKMQKAHEAKRKWSLATLTPYFEYYDNSSNKWFQVWYDDPESLLYKLEYGENMNLRGVGMWSADYLDYSEGPSGKPLTRTIWEIFTEWIIDIQSQSEDKITTQETRQWYTTTVRARTESTTLKASDHHDTMTDKATATGTTTTETDTTQYIVSGVSWCFADAGKFIAILIAVLIVGILNGFLLAVLLQRYRTRKMFKHRPLVQVDAGL